MNRTRISVISRWGLPLLFCMFMLPANAASQASGGSEQLVRATEKGLFTITATLEARGLVQGANALTLTVRDKREGAVTKAQVAVTPWLPASGHGVWEKPVVIERSAGNYRVENVVFTRNGQWDLRVIVKRGSEEDRAIFSLPVGAAGTKPRENAARVERKYPRKVVNYRVPDVTLLNQDGEKVRLQTYLDSGKPVIVDFIYTTCTTVCPVLSSGFVSLRSKLGRDSSGVRLVSISIDPENDRPENMKEYLAQFDAGAGWDFLTGSREDITQVLKAFNAYITDKMEHEPLYILRGPKTEHWTRISGLISGADLMREFREIENR